MARIAIAGFMHETNCFVPDPTDYDDFAYPADRPGMPRGDDMLAEFEEKGAATAGFMAGNDGNHEIYPLLWASATPGGAVTRRAYEMISSELVSRLSQALPVEGVYLDLHGAMVSEEFEDGDGRVAFKPKDEPVN